MFKTTPRRNYRTAIIVLFSSLFFLTASFAQRGNDDFSAPSIMTLTSTFEVEVEQFVLVPITAHDGGAGAEAILFNSTDLPAGLTIDRNYGVISGYIRRNRNTQNGGTFQSTIRVVNKTNRSLQDTKTITWNISPANAPGEKNRLAPFSLRCEGIPIGNGFGSHNIYLSGGTPPYTVEWISPSGETTTSQINFPISLPNNEEEE